MESGDEFRAGALEGIPKETAPRACRATALRSTSTVTNGVSADVVASVWPSGAMIQPAPPLELAWLPRVEEMQ